MNIMGYYLLQTCGACPEQYNVYTSYPGNDETLVGYLRLRHGIFTASRDPTTKDLYRASTKGDGIFGSDEREYHLTKAILAIHEDIHNI